MYERTIIPVSVICALLIMSPSTLCAQDATHDVVEVVFAQQTSDEDLLRIQEEMQAQDIELVIHSKNHIDGLLRSISFTVKTSKGTGSAEGDITPDQKFGFRYDPRPEARVPFSVGSLDVPKRAAPEPAQER